jgi:hypothetical protein
MPHPTGGQSTLTRAYYNEFDPYAAEWLRNLIAAGLIAPGDVDERSMLASAGVMDADLALLELSCLESFVASIVSLAMIRNVKQREIGRGVVSLVPIQVVNVVALRDWSVDALPYLAMQIPTPTIRPRVVTVLTECVLVPFPHDEWERLRSAPQLEPALHEHLVDALPCYPEGGAYLSEAESFNIQLVHLICLLVLAVRWHTNHLYPKHTRKAA